MSTTDETLINGMRKEFLRAYHAGDVAILAAFFSQNAVQLPPNEPAVLGREAIRTRYQAQFDRFKCELAATTEELKVTGDWSFAWGFYQIKLTPKDGAAPSLQDNGKYLAIFGRDDDGSWKFARDMFNSDNPTLSGSR
jgi:ketosteroid isomerase-like protein